MNDLYAAMIRPGKLAAFLLFLLLPPPLPAQESCRIPEALEARPCTQREEARGREQRGQAGDFDFYVLAFSWSPAFCATDAGARSPGQCRDNAFGWVVHGLWPQYAKARGAGQQKGWQPWPQHCAAAPPVLPSVLLRRYFCAMPDARLMQCQWAKHGSCSGLEPAAWFAAIERLAMRFAPPRPVSGSSASESLSAADLRRQMRDAHPGLQDRHLRVIRRDGRVRELRVCLDRNLEQPVDCLG